MRQKIKGQIQKRPEKIENDINPLDIDDSIKVEDVKLENLAIMENKAQIVVMVASTRNVTEATAQ